MLKTLTSRPMLTCALMLKTWTIGMRQHWESEDIADADHVKKEDVGTKDDPSDEENKVKEEPATPCLDVPTAKRMALTPKLMELTPKPMTLTPKPPAMPPPSAYPWRQSADPVPPPQPGT